MNRINKAVFLGARGSTPVSGKDFLKYGGETSCVLVKFGDTNIILDAGSGIKNAESYIPYGSPISILISHPHLDHLLGLPSFSPLYQEKRKISLYAERRGCLSARDQAELVLSEPLWPVNISMLPSDIKFYDISENFKINDVSVDTMESNHPNGSTIYRLSSDGVCVVYATDFEATPESIEELAYFAKDSSLLICDAQYTDYEFKYRKGWGHSSYEQAAYIGAISNSRETALFHHDPWRTDSELDAASLKLERNCFFARSQEEIIL
ncbi:MAG: MBL fold metallo-hydrolase [Lachnospiraceae bacterium]|nr:MBL fold metallo-hydrolase [Lachnospiraceae bacterium]